ncbi:hypothetical protein OCV67_03035 [Porcipelethomonas ammoniilytica]|nr:hypothetical protein [Porcipelethomonas ammoniilytica]
MGCCNWAVSAKVTVSLIGKGVRFRLGGFCRNCMPILPEKG